jgi:osmoprotectant transport system ATP-binding protein
MVPAPADLLVDGRPTVPASGSLYDALSVMLTDDSAEVVVVEDGRPVGLIARAAVLDPPGREAGVAGEETDATV